MKRKTDFSLVLTLLETELEKLNEESKNENFSKAIEYKIQLSDAIKSLQFMTENGLVVDKIEIIKISDKGSESYFTEYNIVDENASENLPEWAIAKNEKGEIKLDCFDFIIKRKK